MNFSRDLTLLANGRWPKKTHRELGEKLRNINALLSERRFGQANFQFWIDRLQERNVKGIEAWQVDGRTDGKEISPEPYGVIEISHRADDDLEIRFYHAADSPAADATYEYIWQLALELRGSGLKPVKDFFAPAHISLDPIRVSLEVPAKITAVSDFFMNMTDQPAYIAMYGSVKIGDTHIRKNRSLNEPSSMYLEIDGFILEPGKENTTNFAVFPIRGLIRIHLKRFGDATDLTMECRNDALLPHVLELLKRMKHKHSWIKDATFLDAIEMERARLLNLSKTGKVVDTAVSQPKDEQKDSNRKIVELLYWLSMSCQFDINRPADLGWVNEQFQLNWGPKESGELFPNHLHADIPEILHHLMASFYLADHPNNFPDAKIAGRFEEMERKNGERISIYPPFGFQIYVTGYGLKFIERELRKGELGKKRNQNGDIEWNSNSETNLQASSAIIFPFSPSLEKMKGDTTQSGEPKNPKAHVETRLKINELITYREEEIKNRNQVPQWSSACRIAGIDPKTAKIHFPELRNRWPDKEFRPEKWEYWE